VQRPDDPTIRPDVLTIRYGRRMDVDTRNNVVTNAFARVDSTTTFDLQRYDNSRFTFGITTGIDTRLMRLSLSASSTNDVIFRYFNDLPIFDFPVSVPPGPQNNVFIDLANSFRFDRRDLRELSGFKIRDFTLAADRFFGDWNASLLWRMTPHRPNIPGASTRMQNFVTFAVSWIPIPEFRSEIDFSSAGDPRWHVEGL